MPLGIGAQGQAGIIKEASWGAGGTVNTYLELVSENVRSNIEMLEAPHVFGSRNIYKYYHGAHDIGGTFSMVVNPDNIGLLLYMALGVEGNPAQVAATTAYDHEFTPADMDTDLGSFALEIERGIDCSIYSGCTVNNFTLSASKGSLVMADFEIVGKAETDGVSAQSLSPSTKLPYNFHMGSVEIATVAAAYVNSFTMTYSNNIDVDGGFVLNASNNRAHAYKTIGSLTGTLECEWTSTSDALRDAYLDNTQKQIELIITSTETIEAGYYYTLSIDIPKAHIMGDPPAIGGRDRIPFSVGFEAVYDSTNFLKITHRDARTTKWSA